MRSRARGTRSIQNDMIDDSAIEIYFREREAVHRWLSEYEQQRKKRIRRMKHIIAWSVAGVLALAGLGIGLGWFGRANGLAQERYFAPKEEQVRRETFEQSKAYNDGMKQELYALQTNYINATSEQKAALRSVILHKVNGYDENMLPSDLQRFVSQLRSGR